MDEQRIDATGFDETGSHATGTDETGTAWQIEISDADVRAAKKAWQAACEGDAPLARVRQLHESYRGIVQRQAQQIAEEFRARYA